MSVLAQRPGAAGQPHQHLAAGESAERSRPHGRSSRGFDSRSQAINEMLHQALLEHKNDVGDDVMVGIIALFYNNAVPGLQKQLADLQVRYIDEVISSLHVHLMNNKTMEVVLVQGPARTLQMIADEMTSRRGVISGKMHLVAALIPQVHPFIDKPKLAPEKVS